ncbi:MAG: glycosyltransferase [Candidatus Didemnitutus sp.]|nr:glycosyltransferase [Candidatus Didemnitutus sp.]
MPRLLIVSAHFPPVNAPDMQRVRMSLPHFVDAGWEVVVLTVDDREPMAPLEPALLATLPKPIHIVRAPIFSRRWTRFVGINNLGLRSLPFLYEAGTRLLTEQKFDLVYFSTTQFVLCPLGRLWQREFGVPYVIDLQDPWLNEYYSQPGAPKPPGGWKYLFTYASAKLLEGWTLRNCAHVISVSSAYIEVLRRRYAWFDAHHASVVTFGAPDADFALVHERLPRVPRILPDTPELKIAYAGRLGPDMLPALDALFAGIARTRLADRRVGLYFYGTSYAQAGTGVATSTALAAKHGISAQIHERPARIGYLDALQLLLEADIALLLGSEDRAYSPSKVYPTLLSGTPALAIAPRDSVLEAKIHELGGAALAPFDPAQPTAAADLIAETIARLAEQRAAALPPLDRARLEAEYTAAAVSIRQLRIFNRVLRDSLPPEDDFDIDDYLSNPIGGTR